MQTPAQTCREDRGEDTDANMRMIGAGRIYAGRATGGRTGRAGSAEMERRRWDGDGSSRRAGGGDDASASGGRVRAEKGNCEQRRRREREKPRRGLHSPRVGARKPRTRPFHAQSASSGCSARTRASSFALLPLWIAFTTVPSHRPPDAAAAGRSATAASHAIYSLHLSDQPTRPSSAQPAK